MARSRASDDLTTFRRTTLSAHPRESGDSGATSDGLSQVALDACFRGHERRECEGRRGRAGLAAKPFDGRGARLRCAST